MFLVPLWESRNCNWMGKMGLVFSPFSGIWAGNVSGTWQPWTWLFVSYKWIRWLIVWCVCVRAVYHPQTDYSSRSRCSSTSSSVTGSAPAKAPPPELQHQASAYTGRPGVPHKQVNERVRCFLSRRTVTDLRPVQNAAIQNAARHVNCSEWSCHLIKNYIIPRTNLPGFLKSRSCSHMSS